MDCFRNLACCIPEQVQPVEAQTATSVCYICQNAKIDAYSRCKCPWLSVCNDCVLNAYNPCTFCTTCIREDESIERSMHELKCLARVCRDMCMLDDADGGNNVETIKRMQFQSIVNMAVYYNRDDLYEMLKRQGLTKVSNFLDDTLNTLPMCENLGLQKTFMKEFHRFLPAKRKHDDAVSLNCWVTKRSKSVRCIIHVNPKHFKNK